MKEFLKPTKKKVVVSIIIWIIVMLFALYSASTAIEFRAPTPQEARDAQMAWDWFAIVLYVVSYMVSCGIFAVKNRKQKK